MTDFFIVLGYIAFAFICGYIGWLVAKSDDELNVAKKHELQINEIYLDWKVQQLSKKINGDKK